MSNTRKSYGRNRQTIGGRGPSLCRDGIPGFGNVGHCAGVPWVSRAMWLNTDKRHLLMKSITGGKLVQADISAFVTCWDQCMCKIWRWHFMWNASNVFSSHESNVCTATLKTIRHWRWTPLMSMPSLSISLTHYRPHHGIHDTLMMILPLLPCLCSITSRCASAADDSGNSWEMTGRSHPAAAPSSNAAAICAYSSWYKSHQISKG